MFRRAQVQERVRAQVPAVRERPAIFFDRFAGDGEARGLRVALEAGDVGSFEDAYQAAGRSRREFLAHVALEGGPTPAVDAWVVREPQSAVANLVCGAHHILWAWEARGGGYAETVDADAWPVFYERLRVAEALLLRSMELADDGIAWSWLLSSGMGLGLPLDDAWVRYTAATEACPDLAFTADAMLQVSCKKWRGNHEEMFDFARVITRSALDGDPRMRLIPQAHFERAMDFRDDEFRRDRYRADPKVQDEIVEAAKRSVLRLDFGDSPQHRNTLNHFAFALGYFGRPDVARPLLELIGDRPTDWPWSFWKDPAAVVNRYRTEAGLAELA